MTAVASAKPLGRKAYGSIGHLPGSRLGPGDHRIHDGQARILTAKCRKGDTIIVQEKLDGSCVAVAKVDGEIVALGRAGYLAVSSPHTQHRFFARWVGERWGTFDAILKEGERIVGEWLIQAHGTRYDILSGSRQPFVPFVPFDIMRGVERVCHDELMDRVHPVGLDTPPLIHVGASCPVDVAINALGESGYYGAQGKPEGVVYRCETGGRVEFLAKFVRDDFVPGQFLPGVDGNDCKETWNMPLTVLWT